MIKYACEQIINAVEKEGGDNMNRSVKICVSFGIISILLLIVPIVYASTLSASKTLTTSKYSGAYMKTTAKVSCPNSGTFSWTSRTASNDVHASSTYTFYNNNSSFSGKSTSKTTVYNWKWVVLKLTTGGSGSSTKVGSGTGKATFTYNSSSKKLSVS